VVNNKESVESLLGRLQTLARAKPSPDDAHGMTFRVPADLAMPGAEMLAIPREVVDAVDRVVVALAEDLRFEYMDNAKDTLRDFVARAWFDRKTDRVRLYVAEHAREILDLTCFVPIEFLKVEAETTLLGIRLRPITDPTIPARTAPWFDLKSPIGSVAAVPVTGTNLGKMGERARDLVAHTLRVARVGLRDHGGIHDRQLRFRIGIAYAFSNDVSGWTSREDVAYEVTYMPSLLDSIAGRPVWKLPAVPVTDIEKKTDLALRWMERARFTGEPLVGLLYLFFALEALLGDKSEGLKADALAFRQLVLGHIVTGGFRHPNKTWFLYDRVRSAAVHGEEAPPVDDDAVRSFEWSVSDTLNDYLTFAADQGITRRGKLIKALTSHPDVPQLADWIRANAGPDWEAYLQKILPPAENTDQHRPDGDVTYDLGT
jgi:hypothetical protein